MWSKDGTKVHIELQKRIVTNHTDTDSETKTRGPVIWDKYRNIKTLNKLKRFELP